VKLTPRDLAIHLGLFVACCVTTTLYNGPAFSATLMTILTCHEFGHYIVARRRGVDVSLPYFIPLPPYVSLGTLGAVIRMNKPIEDRRALFDVGAAGPIAGLVVAIPLLVIGLELSTVGPSTPDGMIEGNSILYACLKYAVFGQWLPNSTVDVQLHPMAIAAWVGLLVTMINLMPIGQLDGGHVARAAFGQTHETWSKRLHVALPFVGLVVATVMFSAAREHGYGVLAAASYAKFGAIPWIVWTIMLGVIRGRSGEYHPAVGDVPLDPLRRKLAFGVLIVFLLIATPVTFRPML
jgi:membrane-associated protease RseP (regulator of RpoE activity)